jgi:hypothetical protein
VVHGHRALLLRLRLTAAVPRRVTMLAIGLVLTLTATGGAHGAACGRSTRSNAKPSPSTRQLCGDFKVLRRAQRSSDRPKLRNAAFVELHHLELDYSRRLASSGQKALYLLPGRSVACIYYGAAYGGYICGRRADVRRRGLILVEKAPDAAAVVVLLPDGAHAVRYRLGSQPLRRASPKSNALVLTVTRAFPGVFIRWLSRTNKHVVWHLDSAHAGAIRGQAQPRGGG